MNWIDFLNESKHRPFLLASCFLAVVGAFLFTRLFALQNGLFFLNDMGRDFLVLWDWFQTGKPPLLGPQNSVLPFNQSALYFYWLMPGYLLSGQSYYASVITLVTTSLGLFTWGIWKLRQHPWWPTVLLSFAWLITLHPTSIEQNRFVWNPSFLAPFLVFALASLWRYRETRHWKWLALFGLGTGISLAFSYSLIPVFVALTITLIALEKLNSWKLILSMALGTLLTHLPTLAFEIRHRFILTQAVIGWIQSGATPDGTGTNFTALQKLSDLFLHTLGVHDSRWYWIVGVLFSALVVTHLWKLVSKKTPHTLREQLFLFTSTVLWGTLLLTFLLPIGVHAHYIFGIATLFFLTIVTLPWWGRIPLMVVLTGLWILPQNFLPHFAVAPRTVEQMVSCAQLVCHQETEPVFVSLESGILPFHNGPDWRYMFTSNGCQVKNLELNPSQANTMLVVAEKATYTHEETQFHELSLFGESSETHSYSCQKDIKVHVLKR